MPRTEDDTREIGDKSYVRRHAEKAGWVVRDIMYVGRRNCLDTMYVGHGRCVLMEWKRKGGRPRLAQQREINRLAEGYYDVHWVDNRKTALEILGLVAIP